MAFEAYRVQNFDFLQGQSPLWLTAPNTVMLVESVNEGYGTVLPSFSVSRSRLDTIDGVTRIIDEVVQETH